MKHYIKVLSLSVPLSFVLGLVMTYYQDQLKKDPDFLKPNIRILIAKGTGLENVFNKRRQSFDFAIKTETCETVTLCQKQFGANYDLAILTSATIKQLFNTKSLGKLDSTLRALINQNHVDFRKPYLDPENRFSLPLLWNVMGFLCPTEMCSEDFGEPWGKVAKEDRNRYIFLSDKFEQERLLERGLWKEFQYHSYARAKDINTKHRPAIQWPSGGVTDKLLYELADYKYRIPKGGASMVIYSVVFPNEKISSHVKRFTSFLYSEAMISRSNKAIMGAFTVEPGPELKDQINKRQLPHALRRLPLQKLIFEEAQF